MAVDPAAPQPVDEEFQPYVSDDVKMKEFTPKAILVGVFFGLLFGASTVYLALKAGLTVSASIPVAVLSISVLKKLGGSTILENNIVQTIGSAGESIASGVVFTLPGFLFLAAEGQTRQSIGAPYFSYHVIFTLAVLGGEKGPRRDIVLINAAAALCAAGKSATIKDGLDLARLSLDSGAAMGRLEKLKLVSNSRG